MERRAHWSDDLIEAVAAVINQADVDDYANVHFTHSDIYAIIAAVEDWARWEHVPKGTLRRLEQAEAELDANGQALDVNELLSARMEQVMRAEQAGAAIARVRDVCDRIWDDARYAHKYGFLEVVREVRYALDGPQ